MKNIITGLSIYSWFLSLLLFSLLFLSSCTNVRTKTVAVRSMTTGHIFDKEIHIMYQKGDTILEKSRLDPTVTLKLVVLE